ncbi:MAG: metallophosphoesterase [Clostridia bacterium]|nr:metallophosphoesterase [Clostridia bacterium]
MRFIVVTDSHFERPELMNLVQEVERRRDIDALFHLGDVEADAEYLRGRLSVPVYGVPGNCDFNRVDPAERSVNLGGVTIFYCHGHTLGVKLSLQRLYYRACEAGAQIALFGHTHARCLRRENGVWLLNPGALADGRYALCEIQAGQLATPQLMEL